MSHRSARKRVVATPRSLLAALAALPLALAAIAVPCSTASADAIVYMQNSQVWVAAPDGSHAHQVTLYPNTWRWPSMADDGTIVAAGGPQHPPYGEAGSDLYVFKGDGNLR